MANTKKTASKQKNSASPYKVSKKRSGRFAVLGPKGKYVNGADKVKILVEKGLVKVMKPKAKDAPPSAES